MTTQCLINSIAHPFSGQLCLADAIAQSGYDTATKIAVAVNGEFVPRSDYAQRQIMNGDEIDIVAPVGGG